jgi:predicted RNase H-like nuclease
MPSSDAFVAGVDGCRTGWVVALRRLDDPARTTVRICASFAEVLALAEAPIRIAVDIPIGLPERATVGGRRADIEARSNLGARQSAVFAVPARAAVMETDYRQACDVAFRNSDPPRKISKQAFYLFPKIREVDALMTPALQDRVVECHPEVAFWGLNGEQSVPLPKKVKSQPHLPGLALRRDLLVAAGYPRSLVDARHFRPSEAGADDVLDAVANSWSAARIARGGGRRFPVSPSSDARGLRMEIWG